MITVSNINMRYNTTYTSYYERAALGSESLVDYGIAYM